MEITTGVERRYWQPEENFRIVPEAEQLGVPFVALARRHQVNRGLL